MAPSSFAVRRKRTIETQRQDRCASLPAATEGGVCTTVAPDSHPLPFAAAVKGSRRFAEYNYCLCRWYIFGHVRGCINARLGAKFIASTDKSHRARWNRRKVINEGECNPISASFVIVSAILSLIITDYDRWYIMMVVICHTKNYTKWQLVNDL